MQKHFLVLLGGLKGGGGGGREGECDGEDLDGEEMKE